MSRFIYSSTSLVQSCVATLVASAPLLGCTSPEAVPHEFAHLKAELRPDSPGATDMFKYGADDVVEHWDAPGGRVRVHFTREGKNAAPKTDANGDGIPDFVESVGLTYEDVLVFYRDTLGFREPISDEAIGPHNGGDGRFDVYLLDFAGQGDGAYRIDACGFPGPGHCAGYMVQENDFAGYGYSSIQSAIRILASHELFHAVQAAYHAKQISTLSEGSAVWATEQFDPQLSDFEGFLPGFFNNADRPLDQPLPGPVDPFSYGMGIFFHFLETWQGPGAVRALWETIDEEGFGSSGASWLVALSFVLENRFDATFSDALVEFSRWNLATGPWGQPNKSYPESKKYPALKIEQVSLPIEDETARVYSASTGYWVAPTGGRESIVAALVSSQPDQTSGLRLLVGFRGPSVLAGPWEIVDLGSASVALPVQGYGEAVLALVNSRLSGSSAKPGLCVGLPAEVSDCLERLRPAGSGEGADTEGEAGLGEEAGGADSAEGSEIGEGDEGSPSGEGGRPTEGGAGGESGDSGVEGVAGGAEEPGSGSGGGCSHNPATPSPPWPFMALFLGLILGAPKLASRLVVRE